MIGFTRPFLSPALTAVRIRSGENMDQFRQFETMRPGGRTRHWFNIEMSAYLVLCLFLVSVAWTNKLVSGVALAGTWMVAGGILALAIRAIYRGYRRP